jgi:hypothetical protein
VLESCIIGFQMSQSSSTKTGIVRFKELVNDHPDFELVPSPNANVCRFRYVPNSLAERQHEPQISKLLNQLNQEIIEMVRRNRAVVMETVPVNGYLANEVSISHGSIENVETTFEAIAGWGRRLRTRLIHDISMETEASSCLSESCSSVTAV